MRVSKEFLAKIDRHRIEQAQAGEIISRSEAIRRLVESALENQK